MSLRTVLVLVSLCTVALAQLSNNTSNITIADEFLEDMAFQPSLDLVEKKIDDNARKTDLILSIVRKVEKITSSHQAQELETNKRVDQIITAIIKGIKAQHVSHTKTSHPSYQTSNNVYGYPVFDGNSYAYPQPQQPQNPTAPLGDYVTAGDQYAIHFQQ